MMATSGAKGNIHQIRQMAGMRGLMADPSGRIIELPIRSNFREGLSVLEYFISTHGARKGLADTALRTADSGYLTRRLIDVAQDVIVAGARTAGRTTGVWLERAARDRPCSSRCASAIVGRCAASADRPPGDRRGHRRAQRGDHRRRSPTQIVAAGVEQVHVRSPLTCQPRRGICQHVLRPQPGDAASFVEIGEAVGIIAAQSIGEPGTQLTMRTFHTGGVAGAGHHLRSAARRGAVRGARAEGQGDHRRDRRHGRGHPRGRQARRSRSSRTEIYSDELRRCRPTLELLVDDGDMVIGVDAARSARRRGAATAPITLQSRAGRPRRASTARTRIAVVYEEREEREYAVPAAARLRVETGEYVTRRPAADRRRR